MRKVLFVANITEHIESFHIPYMKWFQSQGWGVDVAANGKPPKEGCDNFFSIGIERSPYRIVHNIYATRMLKKIIEREKYDIVYCHTPMGAVVARVAARKMRLSGTKVVYMAHGFHFFSGARIINWLLYYPVEKLLSYFTDCIITINQEDYELAKKRLKNHHTQIFHVNGIGVELTKFSMPTLEEKAELHVQYGYKNAVVLLYAAEFIPRKNHIFLIECAKELKQHYDNIKILFAGRGPLLEKLKKMAKKNEVSDVIEFIGFRTDMVQLLKMSDILVSASKQEGLAINIIEGLASGLPILCSNVRGNREMVINGKNGILFDNKKEKSFIDGVSKMFDNQIRITMGRESHKIANAYSLDSSLADVTHILEQYM